MNVRKKRMVLVLPLVLTALVFAVGCEEYNSGRHGGNKKGCFERVLNIDKKTGQTHYEERAVPCKK